MNALWYIVMAGVAAVGAYFVLGVEPELGSRGTRITDVTGKGYRIRDAPAWLVEGRTYEPPYLWGENHWTEWGDIIVTGTRLQAEVAALNWKQNAGPGQGVSIGAATVTPAAGFSGKDE